MRKRKLPLYVSLLIIFGSTLLVSGSATTGWLYYKHWERQRHFNERFLLTTLYPHSRGAIELPTPVLAHLMGLSATDNLYAINPRALEKRLISSELIASAHVDRAHPSGLYIDYTPREPVAALPELPGYGIDREGNTLPLTFSNGQLPDLYLAEITTESLRHALTLLDPSLPITRIDTAQMGAESSGQRQIVMIVGAPPNQHILRLPPRNSKLALANYKKLLPLEGNHVIDLRIPQLAYISLQKSC